MTGCTTHQHLLQSSPGGRSRQPRERACLSPHVSLWLPLSGAGEPFQKVLKLVPGPPKHELHTRFYPDSKTFIGWASGSPIYRLGGRGARLPRSVAAAPEGGSWRDVITVCMWVGVGWLPDKLHDTLLSLNIRQAMNNCVSVSMSHVLHWTYLD